MHTNVRHFFISCGDRTRTRDTYADPSQWEEKAKDLAQRFIKNFAKYEGNEAGKALVAAGPQL